MQTTQKSNNIVYYENLLDTKGNPLNKVRVVIYWSAHKFKVAMEERTFEFSVVMDSEIEAWVASRTTNIFMSTGGTNAG